MPDKLTQLKTMTVVVADTGDIDAIRQYAPEDATTNPSLLLKAAAMPQYVDLVKEAVTWAGRQGSDPDQRLIDTIDQLAVNFGREILNIIPGRVSTEVDARLSFDTEATTARVRRLIQLYQEAGVPKERVLIKIAATWEGIRAAEILEAEGINCNITLLFGFCQAVASAEAGAFLISPFVGRILDWYRKNESGEYPAAADPGVLSVKRIYQYYKKFGYKTIIMGASFRHCGEIEELAGCDRLTIGPDLLKALQHDNGHLERRLDPQMPFPAELAKQSLDEKTFRWHLNEDAMATEKLAEGIRHFSRDLERLETFVKDF